MFCKGKFHITSKNTQVAASQSKIAKNVNKIGKRQSSRHFAFFPFSVWHFSVDYIDCNEIYLFNLKLSDPPTFAQILIFVAHVF